MVLLKTAKELSSRVSSALRAALRPPAAHCSTSLPRRCWSFISLWQCALRCPLCSVQRRVPIEGAPLFNGLGTSFRRSSPRSKAENYLLGGEEPRSSFTTDRASGSAQHRAS